MMAATPITRGAALALAAAVLFGVTTPAIARLGAGVGPFATAACLYGGAALAAALLRVGSERQGRTLSSQQFARLFTVAVFGALMAPSLLAWGIAQAGPTPASLALNLEAVATVLLARWLLAEPIGKRVAWAVACMLAGGTLLVLDVAERSRPELWGVLAVAAATLCWAMDNTLTRPLADNDPLEVVASKGALGALLSVCVAAWQHEAAPQSWQIGALAVAGALGIGVSLRLYLLAQRTIGAARTGSLFAVGPFVGGVVSWLLGDRAAGSGTLLGSVALAFGVYLHVTERHRHHHAHAALEHEHAHRHDDGHHEHAHEPAVSGEHTHWHRHDSLEHEHDHAPDLHHDHSHEH